MSALRTVFVAVAVIFGVVLAPLSAAGTGRIFVDPQNTYVDVCPEDCTPLVPGDPCSVTVHVAVDDGIQDLTGYDFTISYDEDIITLVDVLEGGLPGGATNSFFYWDEEVGLEYNSILVSGAVLGDMVDGPGALATFKFYRAGEGGTDLAFQDTISLRTLENVTIPSESTDGYVEINCPVAVDEAAWATVKSLFR